MSRKQFTKQLGELHDRLEQMALVAQDSISIAVVSFESLDQQRVQEVFALDRRLFRYQLDLEARCLDLIALQAPVARDLRRVGTAYKVVNDLDRIGRYARDIAEITSSLGPEVTTTRIPSLPHMAKLTVAMVRKAVLALTTEDLELARSLDSDDEEVDALNDAIFREVVSYMKDETLDIASGAHYILVSRHLERIADHAVNIGTRVEFLVTGKWPHRDLFAAGDSDEAGDAPNPDDA